jgi:hypothetical protein
VFDPERVFQASSIQLVEEAVVAIMAFVQQALKRSVVMGAVLLVVVAMSAAAISGVQAAGPAAAPTPSTTGAAAGSPVASLTAPVLISMVAFFASFAF